MKREIVGNGMTAHVVEHYDPSDAEDFETLKKEGFGSTIGKYVQDIAGSAARFLAGHGLPFEWGMYRKTEGGWQLIPDGEIAIPAFGFPHVIRIEAEARDLSPVDSQVAYAARMISHARLFDGAVKRGDILGASRWAYEIGALEKESVLKARREKTWSIGRTKRQQWRGQAEENNTLRRVQHARWRETAEHLKREDKSLAGPRMRTALALAVREKLGLTEDERTIRRALFPKAK
jgi:hypothetical protein